MCYLIKFCCRLPLLLQLLSSYSYYSYGTVIFPGCAAFSTEDLSWVSHIVLPFPFLLLLLSLSSIVPRCSCLTLWHCEKQKTRDQDFLVRERNRELKQKCCVCMCVCLRAHTSYAGEQFFFLIVGQPKGKKNRIATSTSLIYYITYIIIYMYVQCSRVCVYKTIFIIIWQTEKCHDATPPSTHTHAHTRRREA